MDKALFITLDDTLILTRSGRKYPIHSKDWMINPDIIDPIKKFYKQGFKVIVIDNQESIPHGFVDERVFNHKVSEIVQAIEIICVLPTNYISYMFWIGKQDEYYKLPNPGLIYDSALEYELNIPQCILIGSSDEDFELYTYSGMKKYYDINAVDIS